MKTKVVGKLPLRCGALVASLLLITAPGVFAQDDFDLAAQEAALLAELKAGLGKAPMKEKAKPAAKKKSEQLPVAKSSVVKKTSTPAPAGTAKKAVLKKSDTGKAKKAAVRAKKNSSSITPKASLAITDDKKTIAPKKKATSTAKKATLTKTKSSVSSSTVASLRSSLANSEERVAQLMAKLKDQRNDLMLAEAEVSRLSRLLEKQRHATLKNVTGYSVTPTRPAKDARVAAVSSFQAKKMTPDMSIATINVNKANLRTGPGKNNSPLMTVSKGTRLAVETRKGEWYRVIAPTGARAWVSSEVVHFGKDRLSEPTRTVKVEGYRSNVEEDAIQLIRQTSN